MRDHFAHAHTSASSSFRAHDTWKHYLGHTIWPSKMAFILDDTDLKTLTVDLRKSFCPESCCASHLRAFTNFRKGFTSGKEPDLHFKRVLRSGARSTECGLPTRPDVDESDFANIAVAIVTIGGRPVGGIPGTERDLRKVVSIWRQITRVDDGEGVGKGNGLSRIQVEHRAGTAEECTCEPLSATPLPP